jgi:hypothetical protein
MFVQSLDITSKISMTGILSCLLWYICREEKLEAGVETVWKMRELFTEDACFVVKDWL